jgi:hypothetical protein
MTRGISPISLYPHQKKSLALFPPMAPSQVFQQPTRSHTVSWSFSFFLICTNIINIRFLQPYNHLFNTVSTRLHSIFHFFFNFFYCIDYPTRVRALGDSFIFSTYYRLFPGFCIPRPYHFDSIAYPDRTLSSYLEVAKIVLV